MEVQLNIGEDAWRKCDFKSHLNHEIEIEKTETLLIQAKCLTCNKVLGYNIPIQGRTECS